MMERWIKDFVLELSFFLNTESMIVNTEIIKIKTQNTTYNFKMLIITLVV